MRNVRIDRLPWTLMDVWRTQNRVVRIKTEGTSMYPLIRSGDHIRVLFSNDPGFKVGDVVVFIAENKLFVHRLVWKRKMDNAVSYCEKGDNRVTWTWISPDRILGKVVSVEGAEHSFDLVGRRRVLSGRLAGYFGGCIVVFWEILEELKRRLFKNLYMSSTRGTGRLFLRSLNRIQRFIAG